MCANCDGVKAKWQTQAIKSIGVYSTEREREYIIAGREGLLVEILTQACITMCEVKPSPVSQNIRNNMDVPQ